MSSSGPWPTVNQLVEVQLPPSGGWLSSRVEDREDDRCLVLAAPFDGTGRALVAQPGAHVVLRWIDERGLRSLDATVTGERGGRVPLWEVWSTEVPKLHQRRRFARVPVMMPVRVQRTGGESLVVTLDLGEGGVLCAAPPMAPFEPEEPVQLSFEVDGRRLETEARVVRSRTARGGGVTVAFRFIGLPGRDADHLRRFVYNRQVQQAVGRR
jgi:c-di-GMP-binding flagellar brake protein YcgR